MKTKLPDQRRELRKKLAEIKMFVPEHITVFPGPMKLGSFLDEKDLDAILTEVDTYTAAQERRSFDFLKNLHDSIKTPVDAGKVRDSIMTELQRLSAKESV